LPALSEDTPSLSCGGEHVARDSRGRLKIFETQKSRVLFSNNVTTPFETLEALVDEIK
jgi:hypothetical protein